MNRTDACVRIAAHSLAARLRNAGLSAPQFDRDQRRDPWVDALVSEAVRDAGHVAAELESRGLAEFDEADTLEGLGAQVDDLTRRVEQLGDLRELLDTMRSIGASVERASMIGSLGGSA